MNSSIRLLTRAFCFLFAVALAWACVPASDEAGPSREHPHIVFLFVDDMGYGDLGSYNADSKIPTPRIDALAEAGMRFTDAHAPGSLCHPSRYGLLTGRYPFRIDVSVWPEQPLIDEGRMTIASLLQAHGYRTAMVGKWHLGFEESGTYDVPLPGGPVDRGFDSFFGMRASTDIPPYFYIRGDRAVHPPTGFIEANSSPGWSPIQGAFWREGGISPDLELFDVLPRFVDESVQTILDHVEDDRPLFLYVSLPAPHTPWLPAEEYEGVSGAGMYGDFMATVDAEIGRLLDALDETGISEETLVIFTSDNGPVWYDHDTERFGHDSAGGLRGMKADAYEGAHRMPFIARWPGVVAPGSVTDQTISFTDMLATFAAIVGADLPRDAGEDSFDVLPVLRGAWPEEEPIRPPVVSTSMQGMRAIQESRWKLIEGRGSGGFFDPQADPLAEDAAPAGGAGDPVAGPGTRGSAGSPRTEMEGAGEPPGQVYDLHADLAETTNLWNERPDVVERLTSVLDELDRTGRSRP